MNKDEALKLALEALNEAADHIGCPDDDDAIGIARRAIQAIAKAEQQEPVAWLPPDPPPECSTDAEKTAFAFGWFKALEAQRLSSPPSKHEWRGLTDEEMHECWDSPLTPLGMKHARMIEAKLKEKNNG